MEETDCKQDKKVNIYTGETKYTLDGDWYERIKQEEVCDRGRGKKEDVSIEIGWAKSLYILFK